MSDLRDTRIKGTGILTLAPLGTYAVIPKDLGQQQAQFVVSNHGDTDGVALTGLIWICDNERNEAIPVYHHESKTIETTAQFELRNPSATKSMYFAVCQMIVASVNTPEQPGARAAVAAPAGGGSGGTGGGGGYQRGDSPPPGKFIQ